MTLSPFEYITVLVSIILGMGITQLLAGIASVVLRWQRIKIYWPHTMLIVLVFIIHIQEWWAFYEFHGLRFWRLPTFLFIMLYPVNLYILARILFPQKWPAQAVDLKLFYYENHRKIYLFIAILPVLAMAENVLIRGDALQDQVVQLPVLLLALLLLFLKRKEEWLHWLAAFLLIAGCIASLVATWNSQLISN